MITFKDGHGINYEAGQFLTFIHHTGLAEIRRSYSILSSPAMKESLAIGVKRIANGLFSRMLVDKAAAGDQLFCSGAAGFFKLPGMEVKMESIVFLAAGSGIVPVFSLIKECLATRPWLHIYLLYSNNNERRTAFLQELKRLQQKYSQLEITFIYSNDADLRKAHLNRDWILDFLQHAKINKTNSWFFVCGPEAYMRMVQFVLHLQGIPPNHIRKEDFFPNKYTPVKLSPPNTGNHQVLIFYMEDQYRLEVNYPDTILQAAKKQNILLPFSCETGKCGNCAALCKEGNIWLSANEVLTDDDLQKGLTLTCVGHPLTDVVIQI